MRLIDSVKIAQVTLLSMCCSLIFNGYAVFAAGVADVVINEVAWMGSVDSASDEWIELYNPTSQTIDLSNWKIVDDGLNDYTINSGSIPAYGYFLIESREDAVKGVAADALITLSLANSGDSLVLKDNADQVIDSVNSAGGAWAAGNSTTKKTMERIDVTSGEVTSNWADNTVGSGAVASGDSAINGTPGGLNSVSVVPATAPRVEFKGGNLSPQSGERITMIAEAANLNDVLAYGFEVTYDPTVLQFVAAQRKDFLNESGVVATSFQAGLENNAEGKVIVAEARTVDPKTTVSGAGKLFEISFDVIGAAGSSSVIGFAPMSFVADSTQDLGVTFVGAQLAVQASGGGGTDSVTGLVSKEGGNRYEIELSWQASGTAADSYKVLRKDVAGNYIQIGDVTGTTFVDKDGVQHGGALIPHHEYEYQVIAVRNGVDSVGVEVKSTETRGLKADANRSDRVDGRDLELVARHFGEKIVDAGFDRRVDTTYDGNIDGSDLLDFAADWADVFKP